MRVIDLPLPARVARLNKSFAHATPEEILGLALDPVQSGRIALVSSFGAEAVVLLHMAAQINRNVPVLFLDTEMLFAETLRYQQEVADALGLTNVQVITPDRTQIFAKDTDGLLHRTDPTACCALRKSAPLMAALSGYDGWITGRKRHQSEIRAEMQSFENEAGQRIKINPLAHMTRDQLAAYLQTHDLPRHPLVARGYGSLGCAPCTHPTAPHEDPRAGRWKDTDKSECGIHLINGRVIRQTPSTKAAI